MRIVVTGGAGFVGSHIVDQLVTAGHDVTVVDDLDPSAHDGAPAGLLPAAEYRWADLRRAESWVDVLDGADAVCQATFTLAVEFARRGGIRRLRH